MMSQIIQLGSRGLAMAVAVALAAVAIPQRSANAALGTMQLTLISGTSTIETQDNGTGDTAPTTGVISVVNTQLNGITVTVDTSSSNSPGAGGSGALNIQSLNITNSNITSVTLTILTTDINFTVPGALPNAPMTLSSFFSETSGGGLGTATFRSFADPNNGQPEAPVLPTGPVSTALQTDSLAGDFDDTATPVSWNLNGVPGPYSLANVMTLTLGPGVIVTLNGTTTATPVTSPVPEPTLGVLPALALGLLARRRRNAIKAV
jgi:MYXO-CTERM domain-containing protein